MNLTKHWSTAIRAEEYYGVMEQVPPVPKTKEVSTSKTTNLTLLSKKAKS